MFLYTVSIAQLQHGKGDKKVIFWFDYDYYDVNFVLDQHAYLDFLSVSQQKSVVHTKFDIHVLISAHDAFLNNLHWLQPKLFLAIMYWPFAFLGLLNHLRFQSFDFEPTIYIWFQNHFIVTTLDIYISITIVHIVLFNV